MPRLAPALSAIACSVALLPDGSAENQRPAKALPASAALAARGPVPKPPPGIVYEIWLASLTREEQQRIDAFCRKHPVEPEEACGGIGPLHIPVPPSMMPPPRGAPAPTFTRDDWYKALTRAQRAYVKRYCRHETYGFSRLCGGTPLVLSLDDRPVRYTQAAGTFALRPGDPVATDWPTADTPWLALDLDGDGRITSGVPPHSLENP